LDWRGRIYTKSFFANYQGSDLFLSLLQFYDGEPLTDTGLNYLYIYGANLYNENKMSKATYDKRIEWTKNNLPNILAMKQDFMFR
jgi:DNA-directed RNA polymerase